MECTVYIATSLAGFIARRDGGIDWLPAPGAEDYGYSEFMDSVDAIVMGRNTFELALTFGAWPYKKPVVVLSNRPSSLPGPLPPGVRTSSGAPDAILAELTSAGARHVYVDGGVTIRRFLEVGRISRVIITTVPVLIGSGVPLFGGNPQDIRLQHVHTRAFSNGLVQSEYRIAA